MDQSLAEIRFRMRHRDVTRLRRMFENVVTAGDTIEGPTLFRQLPYQLRIFHGVYYNYHLEEE